MMRGGLAGFFSGQARSAGRPLRCFLYSDGGGKGHLTATGFCFTGFLLLLSLWETAGKATRRLQDSFAAEGVNTDLG